MNIPNTRGPFCQQISNAARSIKRRVRTPPKVHNKNTKKVDHKKKFQIDKNDTAPDYSRISFRESTPNLKPFCKRNAIQIY